MDDESAEIELLEQNLQKTRQISRRMTSILDSFDTRLAKLEKSILPLYTAAQVLNRRSHNIDQALLKIDEMASTEEDLAAEEALILRGPQVNNLKAYKEALDRLNANIAFKARSEDSAETARLIETGAKKLTQLYTTLVAEASSSSSSTGITSSSQQTSSNGLNHTNTLIPSTLQQQLIPLVSFLRTLPVPPTHPSHPAANSIFTTLRDAQRGYADMRASWCVKCLEGQGRGIVTRASTGSESSKKDPVLVGREFGEWVRCVLDVVEGEYTLLLDLSPISSPSSSSSALLGQSYSTLLSPILKLFTAVLGQLTALIKKSLQKYNFCALVVYDALLSVVERWDDVFAKRSGAGAGGPGGGGGGDGSSGNEIRDGISSLRQICLRSFPEFLVDLKLAATTGNNKESEISVAIVDVTLDTVKYLTRIPPLRAAVSSALMALGDGNWKMGEGIQVGKPMNKSGDVDEVVIVQHFLHDVITNTITSLTTISRSFRRPIQFSTIFLLNNIAFLQYYITSSPASSSSLLAPSTIDYLNSKLRTAKASYFEANFAPLVLTVSDEANLASLGLTGNLTGPGASVITSGAGGGGGGGSGFGGSSSKSQAKDRFTRFYDLLDEVVERHRLGRVLWSDDVVDVDGDGEDDDGSGGGGGSYMMDNRRRRGGRRDCLRGERKEVEDEVVLLVVPSLKRFVMKMKEKEFSRNPQKYIKQSPEEVESRLRSMY